MPWPGLPSGMVGSMSSRMMPPMSSGMSMGAISSQMGGGMSSTMPSSMPSGMSASQLPAEGLSAERLNQLLDVEMQHGHLLQVVGALRAQLRGLGSMPCA